jgi:hypothetical protein
MAIDDAKTKLSIKISQSDMFAYTGEVYKDFANPDLNGIKTHNDNLAAHDLTNRLGAITTEINSLWDAVGGKPGEGALNTKANKAGDTFTGQVVMDNANLILNGSNGTDQIIEAQTNGSSRWSLQLSDSASESGGNLGSNFTVIRYSDSGTFIDTPLEVNRQTGQTILKSLRVVGGGTFTGQGLDIRVQVDEPTQDLHIGTVWLQPPSSSVGSN